jgi:CubicO group peptidase (beta-lactamase class C family)
MATNQVGTLYSSNGLGFGFGFETTERYGAKGMASVGTFGWGGAYGTTYWIDPKARMVAVMMIQMLPNTTGIADRFSATLYQSLLDVPVK